MIILASASPRRRELLKKICDFEVRPTECDESCELKEPEAFVKELSERKANAAVCGKEDIVIAADTVVFHNGKILGKPKNAECAEKMLKALSGQTHDVYTGVSVKKGEKIITFCERTRVKFFDLSDGLISRYVESKEPLDKAGAYGVQEKGCVLVERIEGDYFNVVGLPVARLYRVLKEIGGI